MSVNYKTADNLLTIDSLTDDTYVIVEESGQMKRIKGSELGNTIKIVGITVIIGDSGFESATSTMSFEEAYSIIHGGGFFQTVVCCVSSAEGNMLMQPGNIYDDNSISYSVPCIVISELYINKGNNRLYWTADGISVNQPSANEPS